MKICQVLAGNEDGGLEKHTIELSKQLNNKNINLTVIAHKDFKKYFENIKFIPLDLSKGRNNFFVLYKLFKILKKEKFDIIHTQANKATSMITKLKPFLDSKIVSTLHSYKKNLKPFKKSDFVITVSNKISENLYIENKKTIYNGLPLIDLKNDNKYLYNKYNIPKNKFLITSVGRLCNVKRFDLIIKSLVNLDVCFILVGDGDKKVELLEMAKKNNVKDKVIFTGNINNNEVKDIISLSSLFVISSDKEGFPYVFIESLFLNTPLISTDVSDIKDIIGDKYIIPFNNSEKISEKILFIKNNYENIISDFKSTFDFAKSQFTLDTMVKETILVYKKVLK